MPLCVLGRFVIPEFLNAAARLKAPQVRVGTTMRAVKWPQAVAQAAERLKAFVGDAFALVCDATNTLEDRLVFRKFACEVMRSPHYIEVRPDERGAAAANLPAGIKAAILTGNFVDPKQLDQLELLIVQDCYPTPASERSDFCLPSAVLVEVEGSWTDADGWMRPLRKTCEAPGDARPDWQITCELARAMGAAGFDYASAAVIGELFGALKAELRTQRDKAPVAATDPAQRRMYFRGHQLEGVVRGLREMAATETPAVRLAEGR